MAHEDATNASSKSSVEPQKKTRASARARRNAAKAEQPVKFPSDPRRALSAAANDDEPFAAALIEGLRRTPTSGPLYTAAILTVVWMFIGIVFILSEFGERIAIADSFISLLSEPNFLVACVVIFLPVPFFWTIAYMIRRTKELRLMAQAMLQTSLRLAQPETFTREAVTSVGQAIRGEVAAMSDGIERALARAGELEVLVSNEVTALERSYSDNEDRMKKLVMTIESERGAMNSLTENIHNELEPILTRLGQEASSLHGLIEGSAENMKAIETRITERTEGINAALQGMTNTAQALSQAAEMVVQRSDGATSQLDERTNDLRQVSERIVSDVEQISSQFAQQTDGLHQAAESLQSTNIQIDDALKSRHDSLAHLSEGSD